ncbi:malate transporter, aliminium toerance [Purpureocillium lavendulum]|uniref:Malate transporter, aliminium toerance n=1 Tax=Purpureocillium lavendulum TaxID=1247861 RepID=A0AB34G0G3_9HYPO|nr:malate transporter, aliminium toerance [Purpureocillium lavendulum]
MARSNPVKRFAGIVWGDCQTKAPWQRIIKNSLAAFIAIIIAILPPLKTKSTFLIPMIAVFAHPGQRMGSMIEALLMVLLGSLVGLSWSLLSLYLSSLVEDSNPPAAYTIRALFLLTTTLIHGYVRSSSPRLFLFVYFLIVESLLTIQLPTTATTTLFTTIYVPTLIGVGVALVVHLAIFPELSSSYLGSSTIDTLWETMETLTRATNWFVTPGGDAEETKELCAALTHKTTRDKHASRWQRTKRRVRKLVAQLPSPFKATKAPSAFVDVPCHLTTLAQLTAQKSKLRAQLSRCKAAQNEVNFEISISALPPISMKRVSTQLMTSAVQNIIILIGACENKFIVLGNDEEVDGPVMGTERPSRPVTPDLTPESEPSTPVSRPKLDKAKSYADRIDKVKPVKELETGSAQLLESIVERIKAPVLEFQASLDDAVNLVASCLAYCYDVPTLPSGAPAPDGIPLEEIDLRIDDFTEAIARFDRRSTDELKRAAMESGQSVDLMPRMETFLVSSFLLAFRESAAHVLDMLRHSRGLVDKRQRRHNRSRVWMPHITSLRQWLTTGGEADAMVLPERAKKAARTGKDSRSSPSANEDDPPPYDEIGVQCPADEESGVADTSSEKRKESKKSKHRHSRRKKSRDAARKSWLMKTRAWAADAIEWAQDSDDLHYAVKLAMAVFLVTWPALVASWNAWYTEVRGVWAPMQLILVFEVAIGTSLFAIGLRLFGVVIGCTFGYLAVEIGRGNRIACVAILLFGIVPSIYVQITTKYVKAGIVAVVSMAVVALASIDLGSAAYTVYYKRLVAFTVGGAVAVLVEVCIAPVRARDRLVESLSASVRQVQKMQASLAVGVDTPERLNLKSQKLLYRFSHARDKAQAALAAAETFLPFCFNEPRLKGSFKPLAPIYAEIIYVLHQVIDRMDSVVQLRRAYGSSILEDLNPKVYAYRRSVAATCTLTLFSVNEALTTWLPLPQFIPSARLAQLRLINRVREILMKQSAGGDVSSLRRFAAKADLDEEIASMITKRKFLSWNASTAGMMEIIEYLEELIDLVKLLVGVNAFRSGMLERPNYGNYVETLGGDQQQMAKVGSSRSGGSGSTDAHEPAASASQGAEAGLSLRRAVTVAQQGAPAAQHDGAAGDADASEGEDEVLPLSLQRVGTRLRRADTVVRRRRFTFSGR